MEPLVPVTLSPPSEIKFRGHQVRSPSASLISTPKTNSYWHLSLCPFVSQWDLFSKANLIPALPSLSYDLVMSASQLLSCIFSLPFSVSLPVFKNQTPTKQNLIWTFVLYQALFLTHSFPSSLNFWKELVTLQSLFLLWLIILCLYHHSHSEIILLSITDNLWELYSSQSPILLDPVRTLETFDTSPLNLVAFLLSVHNFLCSIVISVELNSGCTRSLPEVPERHPSLIQSEAVGGGAQHQYWLKAPQVMLAHGTGWEPFLQMISVTELIHFLWGHHHRRSQISIYLALSPELEAYAILKCLLEITTWMSCSEI